MILAFFASVGTWFGGVGGWLKNNPVIAKILLVLGIIVLAWIGKERWKANIIKGVQRQEREQAARIAAEREAQIVSQITENSNEYVRQSERVRNHDVAVQLPDGGGARLPQEHYRD